MKQNHCN